MISVKVVQSPVTQVDGRTRILKKEIVRKEKKFVSGGKVGLDMRKRKLKQKVGKQNEASGPEKENYSQCFYITQTHCWHSVLKYKFSAEVVSLAVTCTGWEPRASAVGSHLASRAPVTESRLYLSDTEPLNTVIPQLGTPMLRLKFSSFGEHCAINKQ